MGVGVGCVGASLFCGWRVPLVVDRSSLSLFVVVGGVCVCLIICEGRSVILSRHCVMNCCCRCSC